MSKNKQVSVPMEWVVPENIKPEYASDLVVQSLSDVFQIYFFQVNPPFIIGTQEEKLQQLTNLDSVKANCVSRLIVTPSKLEEFIDTMKSQLDKYKSQEEEE